MTRDELATHLAHIEARISAAVDAIDYIRAEVDHFQGRVGELYTIRTKGKSWHPSED